MAFSAPFDIRALSAHDLPALLVVQRACYGVGYEESEAVFARRLASPAHCSLALLEGGVLRAYLAAYRSVRDKVTPLHGDFELADAPDTLYLHDLAVSPDGAGRGFAGALLEALWREASSGLAWAGLVAVQGSQGFWARQGFAVRALEDRVQRERLLGYGAEAVYMVRGLR